jgi:hypothetical protein
VVLAVTDNGAFSVAKVLIFNETNKLALILIDLRALCDD